MKMATAIPTILFLTLKIVSAEVRGNVDLSGWITSEWSQEIEGLKIRFRAPPEIPVQEGGFGGFANDANLWLLVEAANQSGQPKTIDTQAIFWIGWEESGNLFQLELSSTRSEPRLAEILPGASVTWWQMFPRTNKPEEFQKLLSSHQLVASWIADHKVRTPPLRVTFVRFDPQEGGGS